MPQAIYERWQYSIIKHALKTRRVIVLSGPRQCGKTTLVKELAGPDVFYRTLDDITLMEAAQHDPQGFIQHDRGLMIIDEIQRVPLLLQAIKQEVDIHQVAGRFLLTGSANIQSLPGVTESLAGRVRKIRLRPLAYGEIYRHLPIFLEEAFSQRFSIASELQEYTKDQYLLDAIAGGYPEARLLEGQDKKQWYQDYLDALIEHDLRDISNIRRQDSMRDLLNALAAWSSKLIRLSDLGTNLGLPRGTLQSYVNALEALYLVERVSPWVKTDYERVNKHDKLFITDTGIMATLLNWRLDAVRLDCEKNGKLLETFVFTQLAAQINAQQNNYQLFHYRDREKREIDFLVENEEGNLLGIEVKASSTVTKDSFKHLIWFKEQMKQKDFVGVVLYTGQHVVSFKDGMWAVPISVLY
jgi:predicted AAA+ superfamily ATPase